MKLLEYIKHLLNENSRSVLDETFLITVYLCAFAIILSLAVTQILSILLIIISIIRFINKPQWLKSVFDLPLLIFIFIRVLSIFFSIDFMISLHSLYIEMPYYGLFYAISQGRDILDKRHTRNILCIFIITAIISSCYGIITVLMGFKVRAESITSGYYNFGTYLTAILVITLLLGKSMMFIKRRLLWYGLILTMSIGILFTLNRIHLGIMVLAVIIIGSIQERKLLLMIAVIIISAILFSPSINQRINQSVHFTEHLSDRDIIWKGASQIWSNHPILGYGPRTFSKIFPIASELHDAKVNGWHNDYLQIYIESGLLGLIAMIWLLITICKSGLFYFFKYKELKEQRLTALSIISGITAILISSLTGSAILDVLIRILFCFLLGILTLSMQNINDDTINSMERK